MDPTAKRLELEPISLDILPDLKDGDSHYWRTMPGTGTKFIQDIFSSIHITIMHTTTHRTNPAPYSKARFFALLEPNVPVFRWHAQHSVRPLFMSHSAVHAIASSNEVMP